jgi:hypothetical protein
VGKGLHAVPEEGRGGQVLPIQNLAARIQKQVVQPGALQAGIMQGWVWEAGLRALIPRALDGKGNAGSGAGAARLTPLKTIAATRLSALPTCPVWRDSACAALCG